MPDDPYKDAPVQNPYDSSRSRFQSGVARQERIIERAYDEQKARRAAEERLKLSQQNAAESAARGRLSERNKAFQEQAKEEGFDDFTYTDAEGVRQSALTEEQMGVIRRQRQEERAEEAEKTAAEFRGRDLSRRMGGMKKELLSDYEREKKKEDLDKRRLSLQMIQSEMQDGRIDATEGQQSINTLEHEISTLNDELGRDDATRTQVDELQEQIWVEEDIKSGRPEGLPRAVPEDPQERKDFIDGYNMRVDRLGSQQRRMSEHLKASSMAYEQRTNEVRARYDEWAAQGVSPAQAAEGRETMNRALTEATVVYLRDRWAYSQALKQVEDEATELSLMRPFVGDAVAAHNTWRGEQKEAAEKIRDEGRKKIAEFFDGQTKELGAYSKEAASTLKKAKEETLGATAGETKEETEARIKRANDLEKQARVELGQSLQRKAEVRQGVMQAMVNAYGSDSWLKAIGEKGWSSRPTAQGERFKIPIGTDKKLTEEFDTTEGNILENVGNATISGLANAGRWLFVTGYKMRPGTTRIRNKHLEEAQKNLGISSEEMHQVLNDIQAQYKSWGDSEKTRVLSDGTINFNPGQNILNRERYREFVNSSKAPQFVKDHMLRDEVMEDYRRGYASTAANQMEAGAALMVGVPTPSEWMMQHYSGPGAHKVSFEDRMEKYLEHYGKGNAGLFQNAQAFAARPWRSLGVGGGKMMQMFSGVGAVLNIPGARDAAMGFYDTTEDLRTGRDAVGGKIPILSAFTDTLLEELPSVAATMPLGGVAGKAGASVASRMVTQGMLKPGSEFAKKFAMRSAIAGQSLGAGIQSTGLSWQQFYSTALAAKEKELGRQLNDDEKGALANSEAVRGRAVSAGILTAVVTRAFGATGEGAVYRHLFTGDKKHTVRDFWRAFKRGNMTDKQVWERARTAFVEIAKDSGLEATEEAIDEFMATLMFDSDALFSDALAAGKEAAKAGAILGGSIKAALSARDTGVTTSNVSDAATALQALKDVYGNDIEYDENEIEEGLKLVKFQPGKGSKDGQVAAQNLRTAIEANKKLTTQERESVSELERATDADDTQRVKVAQRALDKTRQARAILKVANGESIQDLPAAEQKAIRANLSDGTPVIDEVDGQPVITDAAINMLARQLPDAASQLVSMTEGAKRIQLREQAERRAAAEEKAKAQQETDQADNTEGTPAPAPSASPEAKAEGAGATPKVATEKVATKSTPEVTPEVTPEEKAEAKRKKGGEGTKEAPYRNASGKPFSSEKGGKVSLRHRGLDPADYDFKSVKGGGFEAVKREGAAKSPQNQTAADAKAGLDALKGGMREGNHRSAIERFKSGERTSLKNPKAIEAAKKDDRINIRDDGKILGLLDPDTGEWVGEAPTKTEAKPETKAEKPSPSGGSRFRVQLRGRSGEIRTVEVESETRAKAVTAAVQQVQKGETVIPGSVEQVYDDGPAPQAQQQAPKTTKKKSSSETIFEAVGGAFTNVSEDTDAKPLPKGRDWELDENNRLTIRRELSPARTQKALAEALATVASRKALTADEGKALLAALPENLRKLVSKRGKLRHGRDLSDEEAAQYLIENLLTDKILTATIHQQARAGNTKFIGGVLKFLRHFINAVRGMMKNASTVAKRQLQFYEDYALAILKETTSDRALSDLGISLPNTRLTSTDDAVLPPNISRKRGGYEVRMPDGKRVTTKTIGEARTLNANKYERQFKSQARQAIAVATKRGNLTPEELEANLNLLQRVVESIAGKVGISKEAIYSRVRARFVGGEINGVLNALAEGVNTNNPELRRKANAALGKSLAKLLDTNERIGDALNDDSIPAMARRALAASRLATDSAVAIGESGIEQVQAAREAQRRFLELAGRGPARRILSQLKKLEARRSSLIDQKAGLAVEDMFLGESPTAESKAIDAELSAVEAMIEKQFLGLEQSYKKDVKQSTKVRGFETGIGGGRRMVGFTESADASTVLHEFVHVLQKMKDPRTGQSILDEALRPSGKKKLGKWIRSVYPGAKEGDYAWNEAMAEGMEKFLLDGGVAEGDLGQQFATVAAGVQRAYSSLKDLPGFKLNDDTRGILESMFAIDPLMTNQMQAEASRMQGMFRDRAANISFYGDDMVLPLLNGGRQVGFKKERPAKKIAKELKKQHGEEVRVAKHDGKYFAVVSRPGLKFDTKAARIDMLANLSIAKAAELANDFRNLTAQGDRSKEGFFKKFWPRMMRKAGANLKPVLRNVNRAAERAVEDIESWIRDNPQFLDYYAKDWDLVTKIVKDQFDDVTDDQISLFRVLVGITSPNTPLDANMVDAVFLLDHYRKVGDFTAFELAINEDGRRYTKRKPFKLGSNTGATKIKVMHVLEDMHAKLGSWKAVAAHLQEEVEIDELNRLKKSWWTGKVASDSLKKIRAATMAATGQDAKIPRAFLFGPKVGAYTLNNMGDHRYTTTDIWESRFIRSYFPDSFKSGTGLPESGAEMELFQRFATAFKTRLEARVGTEMSPAALQAARWFYMIAKAKESGYRWAHSDGTLSEYTALAFRALQLRNDGRARGTRRRSAKRGAAEALQSEFQFQGGPQGGSVQRAWSRDQAANEAAVERASKDRVAGKGAKPGWKGKLLTLTHWSRKADLTNSSPKFHGTAGAGAELKRRAEYGELYEDRTYMAFGDYKREPYIGKSRYTAQFHGHNIYDGTADPLGFSPTSAELEDFGYAPLDQRAKITIFENRVKAAGYDGFSTDGHSAVVVFAEKSLTKVADADETVEPLVDNLPVDLTADLQLQGVRARMADIVRSNPDGFTVTFPEGEPAKPGWAVAPAKETEVRIPEGELTDEAVDAYLDQFEAVFDADPEAHFGGWKDKGDYVLDISYVVDDESEAFFLASQGDQDGVFQIIEGHPDGGIYHDTQSGISRAKAIESSGPTDQRRKLRGIQRTLQSIIAKARSSEAQGKRGRLPASLVARAAKSLGPHFEAAYDIIVGVHEASGGVERTTSSYTRSVEEKVLARETQALRKWAEERGLIFDSVDFTQAWKKQGNQGGSEHHVIFNEKTKRVDKRTQAPLHDSWLEYFERLALHNTLFPESAYEFMGFMDPGTVQLMSQTGKGTLHAYVSQVAIKAERLISADHIIVASAKRGMVPIDHGMHYDPATDAVVTDTWGDNVAKVGEDENGQPVVAFIDPIIRLRSSTHHLKPEAYVSDILSENGVKQTPLPEGVDRDNPGVQLQGSNASAFKAMKARGVVEPKGKAPLTDAQWESDAAGDLVFAHIKPVPGKVVKLTEANSWNHFREDYSFLYTNPKGTVFGLHYDRDAEGWLATPLDEKGAPAQKFKEMETAWSPKVSHFMAGDLANELDLLFADLDSYDPAKQQGGEMVQLQGPRNREEGARRAAARMKGTPEGKKRFLWKKRSERDAKGQKKVKGDPSRANVSTNQKVRDAYDVSKEIYNDNYVKQHWPDWVNKASVMLAKPGSRADIETRIFQAAEEGLGNAGTPEFQIAAKRVVADRLQSAITSGNQADIDYALALAQAEQEMRGGIAKAMNAMRDPFQSPAQRAAYALGTAIHTAPPGQIRHLKKLHGAKEEGDRVPTANKEAYDADVRKLQKRRLKEAAKVLARHGMDINDIFNAKKEGVGINTKADSDAKGKLSEKQRAVVNMMQEGAEPKAIRVATGVDEKGQKKAMKKYREALEPIVRVLVGRGYNVATMDSYQKGSPPPEGTEPGGKADVSGIMETSFGARLTPKKGFNINDPRHVMAAARALDDMDMDYVTRTVGTWYANVFSSKTVMINLLSLPFAGYRAIAERSAEAMVNTIAQNPESKSFAEFAYIREGLQEYFKMAVWQAYVAYDTEHAYFHSFAKGEGDPAKAAAGETHEDVRGYQMGHLLDYLDIGLEKVGVNLKRPSLGRRFVGQKGADRRVSAGSAARGVLRFNLGVDEFMRFIVAGGEVGAIAYRLGKAHGLTGEELKKFVKQEMVVEGSSSWQMASEEADISVFTQDLPSRTNLPGNLTGVLAGIMNGLDKTLKDLDKSLHAKKIVYTETTSGMQRLSGIARVDAMRATLGLARITLMPFTRVLMNLMQQGFKRVPNPLLLVWTGAKVSTYAATRRGEADPHIAKAISSFSSQLLSHLIALALYQMFEGDDDDRTKPVLITGSMKKFGAGAQEERAAAYREGMGPYRIRVGTGKNAITFDYGRIDPLAVTLGTTVDLLREMKKVGRKDKTVWEAGGTLLADTLAAQMTDKTMLRGMNDTFMMISGRFKPQQWVARQLATVLVPNLIRQPLRDTNTYYDARVEEGGFFENAARQLLYEIYPNAEEKLGGLLPKSPVALPADRDAYGEKVKRPDHPLTPINWITRPQPYRPNRYDEMVRRQRRLEPGRGDIKMPGDLSPTYTYTDPVTGEKQAHKMTGPQYEIMQRAYRSVWRQERAAVTNAEDLTKAKRRASSTAREIAMRNPTFMLEARKTARRLKR